MRTLFIEARIKEFPLKINLGEIRKIKERKLGLIASLQYLELIPQIKRELEKNGKRILIAKAKGMNYAQITGCNSDAAKKIENKVEAFLLLSSGRFHMLQLGNLSKPVYLYDICAEKIELLKKQNRIAALKRFLSSDKLGILVSTKLGQENFELGLKIKEKLEKKGKMAFIFLAENINLEELENFKIDFWVNTACPGLILDSNKLVNYSEIRNYI